MITEIRQKVKTERKKIGFSAEHLAVLAGTQKCQIINFENGKANITINLLEKICNALSIEIVTKT